MPSRAVRTALVVDDESAVVMVLRRYLDRWGYRVITALEGRTAVDLFKEHVEAIDVVLLDLTMPGMNGEEVLKRLRSVTPGVRVVLCTGSPRDEAERRVGSLDGLGFLGKPFTRDQLYAAIEQVIGPESV